MIKVRVAGEQSPRIVEAAGIRVSELLERLGLSRSEHIVLRNGVPLTEDEVLGDGDEVLVYLVKSGG
ncbi:MoaD/ThiS family protein [Desulfurococcus mucosus]|uniref:ThiamineS protein n=1 Tax=Desulfurococcus mucosus (strain ATCC 35584 / DSM 2162 / JCM 9187 / O7/1) TaxID=765177 RepID=E8RA52_DESM0|nr:MoaD/ThiS family protein [Desulfurococcus mucosus]ADV64330.1 hypothetical protein Desmu_0011 [Desulfurococcus mucosus DSM 2162]